MTFIQSVFLGIIQGITEFLPVSSSGHLSILRNLFGIRTDGGLLFDVMVHLGTVIAICVVFRRDVLRMIGETIRMVSDIWANGSVLIHNKKEKDARRYKKILHNNYRRFVVMVLCATIPTAVIGYAARDLVTLASDSLLAPGIGLILTAVFLIIADVSENGKKIPKDISFTNSFLVGIAQGISTLPCLLYTSEKNVGSNNPGRICRWISTYAFEPGLCPDSRTQGSDTGTCMYGSVYGRCHRYPGCSEGNRSDPDGKRPGRGTACGGIIGAVSEISV